jgi:hypothetical protein
MAISTVAARMPPAAQPTAIPMEARKLPIGQAPGGHGTATNVAAR